MHWNEAEHTCGNRIGPMVQLARALCWDFRWSVRTSERFGLLGSVYRHGHTQLGVVDRLFQAAEKAVHESLLPMTAFPRWLWPSEHNNHTGWKPCDVQKQPTIFWGLPDSMVNPAALQKSQAVPRNVRVIATVGGEKLQQKDWTGVQQQGSLSVPVKKLMEIREKVIELGHAQYQLKQVGIDSLRSMNRQTAGGASVPPAQRPWEHQSGGRPESAPAVGSCEWVHGSAVCPDTVPGRQPRVCKECLRLGTHTPHCIDGGTNQKASRRQCVDGCRARRCAEKCPRRAGGHGVCWKGKEPDEADRQAFAGSSSMRRGRQLTVMDSHSAREKRARSSVGAGVGESGVEQHIVRDVLHECGIEQDIMKAEVAELVDGSGPGNQPESCYDGKNRYRTKRDKRLAAMKQRVAKIRRNK